MLIIPAIDIKDGHCVRLVRGDPMKKTVYSEDPVQTAKTWASKGAKRIHVVDLDGAFSGRPEHLETAAKMKKETGCEIEFGGGLRDRETVKKALDLEIDKVILGTAALESLSWVKDLVKAEPRRFIVGIDSMHNVAATSGWKKGSEMTTEEALKVMEAVGFRETIFTDILRDGTLEGPNLAAVQAVVKKTGMKVFASGGVSKLEDLKALKKIKGLAGVVVGKALYDGQITLEDGLKICGPQR